MPNPEDRLVPGDRPVRPEPRHRGGWLRTLLVAVLLLALLVLSLPMLLQHGLRLLLERASGEPVTVGAVQFQPADRALELFDLRVGEGQGAALRLQRLSMSLDTAALLEARLRFSRVQLESGQVSVERGADGWLVGGIPLSGWRRLPLPAGGSLDVQQLQLLVHGAGGTADVSIDQLLLEHFDPYAPRPARFSVTGHLGEGQLQAEGLADLLGARPALTGELRLQGLPAGVLARAWGDGEVTAQGQGDLRGRFEARYDGALHAWQVRLPETRLSVADLAVERGGSQLRGGGEWRGEAAFSLADGGPEQLAAHGVLTLNGVRLTPPAGPRLEAASLRWEGAVQVGEASGGWAVDGDGRLQQVALKGGDAPLLQADTAELWGLSGRPEAGWQLGRARLEKVQAGLPLAGLELVGLSFGGDRPPMLERARLLGADAVLVHGADGWHLQGHPPAALLPARVGLLEVGGGSRLRLREGDAPLADLDEVELELAGLDANSADHTAGLQLRARLGGGAVYVGGDVGSGSAFTLTPSRITLEQVALGALDGPLSRWFGVRADGGSLSATLRFETGTSVTLAGEAILEGALLTAVDPDPFRGAAGTSLPAALKLLRDADGNVHLPVTLPLTAAATPAAGLAEVLALALESAYQPLLAAAVDPQHLNTIALATPEGGFRVTDAATQLRLMQLTGALAAHPAARLWICAAPEERTLIESTLTARGVAAGRLDPCPAGAASGPLAWGLH